MFIKPTEQLKVPSLCKDMGMQVCVFLCVYADVCAVQEYPERK